MGFINRNVMKSLILLLPALSTFCIFIFVSWRYALNLPFWDDYDQGLDVLNHYLKAQNLLDKLFILISQHNEHRILEVKILYLVYYKVFGVVNFRNLIFISQFILLIGLFPLYSLLERINRNNKIFNLALAISLMLCPSQSGYFVWLGALLQQATQVLVSLSAINSLLLYCEHKKSGDLWRFITVMLVSLFVGGVWVCLILSILMFLVLIRRFKLAFGIIILALFMIILDFKILPYQIAIRPFPSVYGFFVFLFGFVGSTFFLNMIGTVFGVFLILIEGLYIKSIFKNKTLLLWSIFFLTTVMVVGLSRAGSLGLENRYAIYSLINIGMILAAIINKYKKYIYKLLIIYMILLFNLVDFKYYGHNDYIDLCDAKWMNRDLVIYPEPNQHRAIEIYNKSKGLGIYSQKMIYD